MKLPQKSFCLFDNGNHIVRSKVFEILVSSGVSIHSLTRSTIDPTFPILKWNFVNEYITEAADYDQEKYHPYGFLQQFGLEHLWPSNLDCLLLDNEGEYLDSPDVSELSAGDCNEIEKITISKAEYQELLAKEQILETIKSALSTQAS